MPVLATDTNPEAAPNTEKTVAEPPRFSFKFRGRKFSAWTQDDTGGPQVCLACEIGSLPYSAENRDGRRAGLMILSAAGHILSSRLLLTDFHRISLMTTARIADTGDIKSVVAAAATSLLCNLPLIELMENSLSPDASGPEMQEPAVASSDAA